MGLLAIFLLQHKPWSATKPNTIAQCFLTGETLSLGEIRDQSQQHSAQTKYGNSF
ncbi:uncharacterized protein METZ01_LOCUS417485 [marine metagenome]|uniref:Uncharacterized protein n=1 Tax=marine metagenome TaxID=408172 RepID=A0A382X321_9ZZZZ